MKRSGESSQQSKQPYQRKINGRLFFLGILIGLCTVLFVFFFQKLISTMESSNIERVASDRDEAEEGDPLLTPMPFREMTVPYLRDRTYESTLSDREIYTTGSTYTSYLTSYDSDGFEVNGLLTIPDTDMPDRGFPAIVFVHGYIPPTQYQTTQQYADYVDYLARNGFVVFKIDLRGHGNSEGEPGGGYYGSDYVVDTLNAVAALSETDFVNPENIGLWGHSMAGNVVLRSMVAKPDLKAGVVWAGAVFTYEDWEKYGIDDNSYQPPDSSSDRQRRRQMLFDTHGRYSNESEFWQQVSPKQYLSDLTGAIQLNHAVDDAVVNIGYSRDLAVLLEENSIEYELHEYQGGGHNITSPYFTEAMNNTVSFFSQTLR